MEIDKRIGYPTYREFQPFQCMKENFQDAKTLQPVSLPEGEFKQFFLTARADASQKPGLYKGAVRVQTSAEVQEIPAVIRVLPFVLPKPCAYADPFKPFLVASYSYISLDMI